MTRVEQISVLAKPSPAEDFDLVRRGAVAPPPAMLDVAYAWLQAHVDSGNDQSVTVVTFEGGQWLLRGADDAGTDNAGRPLSHLVFGRLAEPLGPALLTRLLFGAFRQRRPARDGGDSCEIELGPASPLNDEIAARAVLALALGVSRVAVVDTEGTAASVLGRFEADRLAFVSLMRRKLPARWPGGAGLVVSQAPWEPALPAPAAGLTLDRLREVDLGALAGRVKLGADDKAALLRVGLDGDAAAGVDGHGFGEDAFDWLLRSRAGRAVALRRAGREQVTRWLREGALAGAEVSLVADRLSAADVQRHFRDLLVTAGMPEPVYAALFLGARQPSEPPLAPPAPEPEADWVRFVPAQALWAAGLWACADDGWRRHWCDAVRVHPDLGERASPSIDAVWSEPLGAWVMGASAAGELDPRRVLGAWERWNGTAGGPSDEWQPRLARAAGLARGPALDELLRGRPSGAAPTAADLAALRALIEAGVVTARRVLDLVARSGAPVAWLEPAEYAAAALALIDVDSAPPVEPPGRFPSELEPLLADACSRPAFWARFAGQLTRGMLAWLAERAAAQSGGARLRAHLAAYDAAQRLGVADIEMLAPALPAGVICRQAVAWAFAAGAERPIAIAALLRAPSLRPELGRWLAAELLSAAPVPPPPALRADEMLAVLPLLHPVRDVLRPLLAEPRELPDEEALVAALMPALERMGAPPLPAPDEASLARHPALARQLARLPSDGTRAKTEATGRSYTTGMTDMTDTKDLKEMKDRKGAAG